jgi:hypothetical protein
MPRAAESPETICRAMATSGDIAAVAHHLRADMIWLRKPAFDLSDVVRLSCRHRKAVHWRYGRRVLLGRRAVKPQMPHSGASKARGLTAKALTERSSLLPRRASPLDSVREINQVGPWPKKPICSWSHSPLRQTVSHLVSFVVFHLVCKNHTTDFL